jgi:hypothetical protein
VYANIAGTIAINVTGNEEFAKTLEGLKPLQVNILDSIGSRLIWEIIEARAMTEKEIYEIKRIDTDFFSTKIIELRLNRTKKVDLI